MSHCVYTRVDEIGERFSVVGVVCVICGNLVISCGMNILKHMAYVIPKPSDVDPLQVVLVPDRKSPWWWTGVAIKFSGETMLLLANGFAAASVVAVATTVSGIFQACFAVIFFGEVVTKGDAVGMGLIACGSVLAILFGPGRGYNLGAESLLSDLVPRPQAWAFMVCSLLALVLAFVAARQWGETQLLAYVVMSSVLTMVSVMAAKGYASIAKLAYFNGQYFEQFSTPVPWCLFAIISLSSAVAAIYLNRAVTTWGNREVIPVFVVLTTFLILIGAASFYGEFDCSDPLAVTLFSAGFVMASVGIFLVNVARSDKTLYTISSVHQLAPLKAHVMQRLHMTALDPRPFTYKERARAAARGVLFWPKFAVFYVGMILIGTLTLVYTIACFSCPTNRPFEIWLILMEALSTAVLIAEVGIRIVATEGDYWTHASNVFDLVVAGLSVGAFALIIVLPAAETSGDHAVWIQSLAVVRDVVRGARLVVFVKNYRRLRRATTKQMEMGDFDISDDLDDIDRDVVDVCGEGGDSGATEDIENDNSVIGGGVMRGGMPSYGPRHASKPPLPERDVAAAVVGMPSTGVGAEAWWRHVHTTAGGASNTHITTPASAASSSAARNNLRTPVLPSPPTRSPAFAALKGSGFDGKET